MCGCDGHGEAIFFVRGRRGAELHEAGGDVAMEVEVQWLRNGGGGVGEGGHEAEHGDHGWEWVGWIWSGEGDMENWAGVDD